jgi:hypothetical protein
VELSVKYTVKSFAVLWQRVFQAVVCMECRAECSARHSIHTCLFTVRDDDDDDDNNNNNNNNEILNYFTIIVVLIFKPRLNIFEFN